MEANGCPATCLSRPPLQLWIILWIFIPPVQSEWTWEVKFPCLIPNLPHLLFHVLVSFPCAFEMRLTTSKFVPSSPPRLQCPQAHSLCLHLYSCHANRLISTIFLDSLHMLGIYPEKTITQKDSSPWMFTAALFTTARTGKQPRCPLTDEWIKKMWCVCIIEYYSVIKRNEIESVEVMWMNLEPVI